MIAIRLVCLVLLFALVAAAPEPTPTLDRLEAKWKPILSKRAKDMYRLPDGRICDFHNAEEFLAAYKRAIKTTDLMTEQRTWNASKWTKVGEATWVERTPDLCRWVTFTYPGDAGGMFPNARRPPLVQAWKAGKEIALESTRLVNFLAACPRVQSNDIGWIRPMPMNEYSHSQPFKAFPTSDPGVMRVDLSTLEMPQSDLGRHSSEVYVRSATSAISKGQLVGVAFFIIPIEIRTKDKNGQDAITLASSVIDGASRIIYELRKADDFRLSAEDLAAAIIHGDMWLVDWSCSGEGSSLVWTSKRIEPKLRP